MAIRGRYISPSIRHIKKAVAEREDRIIANTIFTGTLRVTNADGKTAKITPLVGSIVSSGIYASPTELNGDDTYGFDIDLPGNTYIPAANLSVISIPRTWGLTATVAYGAFGSAPQFYMACWYANSAATYYTMDPTTEVMSTWTAGNCTLGDINTWDALLGVSAFAHWRLRSDDLYKSIRILPAVANYIWDKSAEATVTAYNLNGLVSTTIGVQTSIVSVIIKEWDY